MRKRSSKFSQEEKNSMKPNMIISYDPDADVLSWDVASKARISYATEMGNVIVHFTEKNLPVLIEVLEASKMVKQSTQKIRQRSLQKSMSGLRVGSAL